MDTGTLSGRAAIAGFAEFKPVEFTGAERTMEMLARAGMDAIADAGFEVDQVDGLVTEGFTEAPFMTASTLGEYMGLTTTFSEVVDNGGATAAAMVIRAAAAIAAGLCETVVCVTAARRQRPREDAPRVQSAPSYKDRTPQGEFDVPYGATGAVYAYAMFINRYRERYEATPEQLARVAVAARENAGRNPEALLHDQPITVDDVLASPMVVDPIKELEMAVQCGGAAAVVVTRVNSANAKRHPSVAILGAGEHYTHRSVTWAPSLEVTPTGAPAKRAFAMANLRPADMNLVCLYDCYTTTVLMTIEDTGFTPKGTGGRFLEEHDLSHIGDFPLNTHGGQLAFGQAGIAGGMSLVVEATRQLMGRATDRQVRGCELAFVNGNGGEMSAQSALVLGRLE